jgi:hypothetical protein
VVVTKNLHVQLEAKTGADRGREQHQERCAEFDPRFDELAAELRSLTKSRKQTPSEILLREGRDLR